MTVFDMLIFFCVLIFYLLLVKCSFSLKPAECLIMKLCKVHFQMSVLHRCQEHKFNILFKSLYKGVNQRMLFKCMSTYNSCQIDLTCYEFVCCMQSTHSLSFCLCGLRHLLKYSKYIAWFSDMLPKAHSGMYSLSKTD